MAFRLAKRPSVRADDRITLELWRADAIVLFDWLMTVDFNAVPHNHRAERQALIDLLTQIEQSLISPTAAEIAEAREAVSREMGS